MTDAQEKPALAELRARTALRSARLDPTVPLERATSVTNEVWLTPTHVVRVNRRPDNRLAREATLAATLPPAVGYPTIVAVGAHRGGDWLVVRRVSGTPLAHRWPDLDRASRRSAVKQLAKRLAAVHTTRAPDDLPPMLRTPHLLEIGTAEPVLPVVAALEKAATLKGVDPIIMSEAIELVRTLAPVLEPFESETLVHGDVTFENVLWDDGEVTALLDLEWSRRGPRDLDLDIILRCCAHPELHVGAEHVTRTSAQDYQEVPAWLAEDYPELFSAASWIDRLRVYSIAYDVRELLAFPPAVGAGALPSLHPYHRLVRVVQGRSYLDSI